MDVDELERHNRSVNSSRDTAKAIAARGQALHERGHERGCRGNVVNQLFSVASVFRYIVLRLTETVRGFFPVELDNGILQRREPVYSQAICGRDLASAPQSTNETLGALRPSLFPFNQK